jgi:serine/threonine protein kinase
MKIERLSPRFYNNREEVEILEKPEFYPHLEEIAKEVFVKSNEIGSGNHGEVYRDELTGFCCKRWNPTKEKPQNNVHQEAEFLEDLSGLSEKVKVPKPLVSMDTYVRNEEGRIGKCSILVMDTIKGANLKEITNGEKKLPENFDIERFFSELKSFITLMHEKGIYHNDIADRNIMVEFDTCKPVLVDFGSAVYFSTEGLRAGDKDPYGRLVKEDGVIAEELDLEYLEGVEIGLRKFIDKI